VLSEETVKAAGCKSEEVAAYLDGELNAGSHTSFEAHLKQCRSCALQLEEQKRLLCALDFALGNEPQMALPKDFAQVVAVHAENDLSGVRRSSSEHKLALRVSAALALVSFALLGSALRETVLGPIAFISKRVVSIFDIMGRIVYDAGAGLAVISRTLGGHLLFESYPLILVSFLLVVGLALLLYLLGHYYRARTT
jgi:predicted anti-sigma-YlaC factor YlaD